MLLCSKRSNQLFIQFDHGIIVKSSSLRNDCTCSSQNYVVFFSMTVKKCFLEFMLEQKIRVKKVYSLSLVSLFISKSCKKELGVYAFTRVLEAYFWIIQTTTKHIRSPFGRSAKESPTDSNYSSPRQLLLIMRFSYEEIAVIQLTWKIYL